MERLNIWTAGLCMIALAILTACGGGTPSGTPELPQATTAPTRAASIVPTPPAGWTPYSRSSYQIALPDSWQEVKLTEAALQAAIASAQQNNPPLADPLRVLLDSGQYKSFAFYALDPNNATNLRNVSVAHLALEGTNNIQTFALSYAEALPNVVRGSKIVQVQSPLRINGMDAATIVYDVSLVDVQGNLATLRGVQYLYLLDSGEAYLVTVTGSASDADNLMPLARQIGTSFFAVNQ